MPEILSVNPNQIKIEKIKLKNLNVFAKNALNQAAFQTVAPISLLRCASQPANPYGRPDDVALLVAYAENECVGYQGLLAGLFHHEGVLARVHWSTAFYVAPDYRGQGVAGCLLDEVKKLNVDFPVTRMTDSAQRAYVKSGFKELGRLTYYQLRVEKIRKLDFIRQKAKASPETIQGKSGNLYSGPAARDAIQYQQSKKIFYQRLMADIKDGETAFAATVVDQINPEAQTVMQLPPEPVKFHRGIEAINWMLKSQWVVSAQDGQKDAGCYHFSTVRDLFKYVALEFYSADNKAFKGFLILSVSSKKGRTLVKILDFAFKDAADCFIAGYFGLKYANKYHADRLEFPEILLDYFNKNQLLQPLIKKQRRLYVFYPKKDESPLDEWVGDIALDYCDADTVFT